MSDSPSEERRVRFDFEVESLDGGGVQGQVFRLDTESRPSMTEGDAELLAGAAIDRLPDRGVRFSAVPVKVKGFGTFPVRAFVTVDSLGG